MKCKLLHQLLKKSKRIFWILLVQICFSGLLSANSSLAQGTGITGQVNDENGNSLPGVSVLEKGTTNGTITDIDGKYALEVANSNSTIIFSYVGYVTEEIVVGNRTSIDLAMVADLTTLDELVVVGYGTQKRSELTNAVVQATGEEIKKTPAISLGNSLAGRLPGLYVNQTSSVPGFDDPQILVRGFNTYRDNSALIVIDGVANADPDGLNRLDPNDIESISVLKDASAAIYGAQSAGGVILVTTKRGKSGKPQFTYTGTYGFLSPTSKTIAANAVEYMEINNSSRALDGTAPDFPDEIINDFKNGTRQSEDWWDAIIDPPVNQWRQSLTMRGGTDNVKYFTSVGMADQGGIITGDDKTRLKQYNIRSNIDVAVAKSLDIGLDITARQKYTQTPQQGAGGNFGFAVSTSPLREAFLGGDTRYPSEGWSHLNPVARVKSPGYRKYTSNVFGATVRADWDIPWVKGLSLGGFASIVAVQNYDKEFNYLWPYYEYDTEGEIVKKISRSVEDIGLREDFWQSNRITLNAKLAYETTISEKHNISAFVAYEQMEYDDNGFWAQRLGYDSPKIDQLFAGSTIRSNWNNSGSASESARQNYFGRVNYDFSRKYLFGFNFRYDGSPIFPEETRFGFFPGLSAGWLISEEAFMGGNTFSNLKLRASWGQTGNDRVDPFQYIGVYEYSDGYVVDGTDQRGIAAATTPNPEITWEVSDNTNIGLEVGVLQGRLNFELDVFKITTSNILGRRQSSIPQYTGLELPDENIGEMENKGIEFQTSYSQIVGDWTFRASGNISYQKNEIIYFDEVPQSEEYQKLEGMPFGSELVYKSIGIYRTQDDIDNNVNYSNPGLGELIFEDMNDDGLINANDRYMADLTPFPKYQYGINLGADFKGFDLNILFFGQGGGMWRMSNGFDSGAGGNGLAYVAQNSYTLDNTSAELPRIRPTGTASSNSDFWYIESNWMRLKALELGYTFPSDLLSQIKIQGLRVYFSGENLFLLYNSLSQYKNGDPQWNSGNGGNYPNMRALNFGINLTF